MRRFLSIIIPLLVSLAAHSQDWEGIKADSGYVWGEGWGRTLDEADRQALSALVSKVTVSVTSDYRQVEQQVHGPNGDESSVLLSSTVMTSSSVTLTNARRVVLKSGRRFHVGRWIPVEDLEDVFSDRMERALEYERSAVIAERNGRIDDALRLHYWAYTLIRSLQRPSEARDGGGHILVNHIPEEINSILSRISVSCTGKTGDVLSLRFTCNGRPVQGLDYSFFDGTGWVRGTPVKDGNARLQMARGALCDYIQVRIEYVYRGEAVIDRELYEIMDVLDSARLRKSEFIFRR